MLLRTLLTLSLLAPSFAFAMGAPPPLAATPLYSASCKCDGHDPYDLGPVMPSGAFRGQCQNNCQSRTIHVAQTENGRVLVTNIRNGKSFYMAWITFDDVQDVILQTIYFPMPLDIPGAGHTQSRYRFTKPVELIPQLPGSNEPHVFVRDLIYSAESSGPAGVPFDVVVRGMRGDYVLAYRMRTLENFVREKMTPSAPLGKHVAASQMRRIRQLLLHLTHAEKVALLKRAIEYGDASKSFNIYNTLQKSCSTEFFFPILDHILASTYPKDRRFDGLPARYPVWNEAALHERGIADSPLSEMNAELQCRGRGGAEENCLRDTRVR